MAWAKIDDGWWCHPKVMALDLAASGLWASALSWSCAQKTPLIPTRFPAMVGGNEALTKQLEATGLWHGPGHDCEECDDPDTGWVVHNWFYWQFEHQHGLRRSDLTWAESGLLNRDGWLCANCGADCGLLTIDHIVPVANGGTDIMDNFQWLCLTCNGSKSDHGLEQWVSSGEAARSEQRSPCRTQDCGHGSSPRSIRLKVR